MVYHFLSSNIVDPVDRSRPAYHHVYRLSYRLFSPVIPPFIIIAPPIIPPRLVIVSSPWWTSTSSPWRTSAPSPSWWTPTIVVTSVISASIVASSSSWGTASVAVPT